MAQIASPSTGAFTRSPCYTHLRPPACKRYRVLALYCLDHTNITILSAVLHASFVCPSSLITHILSLVGRPSPSVLYYLMPPTAPAPDTTSVLRVEDPFVVARSFVHDLVRDIPRGSSLDRKGLCTDQVTSVTHRYAGVSPSTASKSPTVISTSTSRLMHRPSSVTSICISRTVGLWSARSPISYSISMLASRSTALIATPSPYSAICTTGTGSASTSRTTCQSVQTFLAPRTLRRPTSPVFCFNS